MPRLALLVFTLLLASGCGAKEKELPKEVGTPPEQTAPVAPVVPKESEAAAAAFMKERIAIITDKHPERMEKLKSLRQKASGRWQWPAEMVNARREIEGAWPDRTRVGLEFSGGQITGFRYVFRDQAVSFLMNQGMGLKPPDPAPPRSAEQTALDEMFAEVWLPTLVPAVDPQAVFFDLKKQPLNNQMSDTVKLALPNRPVVTLWFDANSGTLGLIAYEHLDQGAKTTKQVLTGAYKPVDGVNLPTQFFMRRGGAPIQEWTVSRWEFPERIDDSVFDPKK